MPGLSSQGCHGADGAGDLSRSPPLGEVHQARVLARTMPPWFLDKTVGIQHFANDASLSDQQIATIVKWVDSGSPQGDPKDMPAAQDL